jgi:uncharacterized protein (DUF305 family)
MKRYAALSTLLLIVISTVAVTARQSDARHPSDSPSDNTNSETAWSEFNHGMQTMHSEMGSIKPSGNSDLDFVRLMLPHHQAAIDMAKTELEYGKDPQMRRLAQEIITDQQSETELIKLWLKQHESSSQK